LSIETPLHFNLAFSQRLLCKLQFPVTLATWTELCITVSTSWCTGSVVPEEDPWYTLVPPRF